MVGDVLLTLSPSLIKKSVRDVHNGMGHHTKITLARLKWNTAELHCTPCLHVLRQRVTGGQGAAIY